MPFRSGPLLRTRRNISEQQHYRRTFLRQFNRRKKNHVFVGSTYIHWPRRRWVYNALLYIGCLYFRPVRPHSKAGSGNSASRISEHFGSSKRTTTTMAERPQHLPNWPVDVQQPRGNDDLKSSTSDGLKQICGCGEAGVNTASHQPASVTSWG